MSPKYGFLWYSLGEAFQVVPGLSWSFFEEVTVYYLFYLDPIDMQVSVGHILPYASIIIHICNYIILASNEHIVVFMICLYMFICLYHQHLLQSFEKNARLVPTARYPSDFTSFPFSIIFPWFWSFFLPMSPHMSRSELVAHHFEASRKTWIARSTGVAGPVRRGVGEIRSAEIRWFHLSAVGGFGSSDWNIGEMYGIMMVNRWLIDG